MFRVQYPALPFLIGHVASIDAPWYRNDNVIVHLFVNALRSKMTKNIKFFAFKNIYFQVRKFTIIETLFMDLLNDL